MSELTPKPEKNDKLRFRRDRELYGRSAETPLSEMEFNFIQAYLREPHLGKAAIAAGSKAVGKSASVVGSLLMKRPNVAAEYRRLRRERAERTGIDSDYVLEGFKEIAHRCLQREPVMEWDGEAWVPSGEWKFDSAGANKAFEHLAKHIGFFDQDNKQKRAAIQINIDRDDEGL